MKSKKNSSPRQGVVLVVVLVIMAIMSALVYSMTSRILARRYRDQYLMDYQQARYACDSGLKYAMSIIETIDAELVPRPNEPDFSDMFMLTEDQYEEFMDAYAVEHPNFADEHSTKKESSFSFGGFLKNLLDDSDDANDVNDTNDVNDVNDLETEFDIEGYQITGPYGPVWPLVTEPIEIQVGTAKVKIEIEDENAKYPLTWALLNDRELQSQADAGFETFCQWSQIKESDISDLKMQLRNIQKQKEYKLTMKPIKVTQPAKEKKIRSTRSSRRRRGRSSRRSSRSKATTKTRANVGHTADFAKLLHSPLVDTQPFLITKDDQGQKKDPAAKYISFWGTEKVNINTAPRHVLEAAFSFGGDSAAIAEDVITQRQTKPFKDANDLDENLYGFSDSLEQSKKFIIFQSRIFRVKVTATSGNATASSAAGIVKDEKNAQMIGIISD